MSPHPVLLKRFIRFQMITVVSIVVLGVLYALGLWLNNGLLLSVLDPLISIVANVAFYGLFLLPAVWILGKFVFVKVFSRQVDIELKERLQRLAVETMHRMGVNQGDSRFVVSRGSSSASARSNFGKDRIVVGDRLLQESSDEEVIGVLGHEIGHVLKKHVYVKGLFRLLYVAGFLAVTSEAARSRPATILGVTAYLAIVLAEIPLSWRLEYSADRFSAEKLGPNPIASALEKLKVFYPDCASFTHPPISRRIKRIRSLSITPLITHVYG